MLMKLPFSLISFMISNLSRFMFLVLVLRRKRIAGVRLLYNGLTLQLRDYHVHYIQMFVPIDQLTGLLATKPTFCVYYVSHMRAAVYQENTVERFPVNITFGSHWRVSLPHNHLYITSTQI